MKYYSGLDVSLKTTFISIVDEKGKTIQEGEVETDEEAITAYLKKGARSYANIGIESGQLSISLCKGLRKRGFKVTCVDARQMAAALSARINKNDKNDARGTAQMMRVELFKEVHVKSDLSCERKLALGSRSQLVRSRQQLKGTIRGLLKIWGIKLSLRKKMFATEAREKIKNLSVICRESIGALLTSLAAIEGSLVTLDKKLIEKAKADTDCEILMSAPGVGVITALTYQSTLDEAGRFEKSETVGAYLGLTPRQYASGEVNRQGRISKMGPSTCRNMLYEAAMSLLTRSKQTFKLKTWGLKLAKKKGLKKAIVAVARKLAVIMHRMLIDKKEFCYDK